MTQHHPFAQISTRPTIKRTLSLLLALGILCFGSTATLSAQTPEKGGTAPDFSLNTPDGHPVRLTELTNKQEVVLIVLRGYPGYQCPFCQKQVHDYIDHASEFAQKKIEILLVYPGPPADLDQHAKEALAKQADLPANMHLVVDPDYKVTNLYGLRWDAPHETAYPSTFVLDKKRVVLYQKVSHSHGDRSSAEDVLKEIPMR